MVSESNYTMFKNHAKLGNMKIDKNTMIFNMGAGMDCPSYCRNYCTVGGICYARKAEKCMPGVLDFRRVQAAIWNAHSPHELAGMFVQYVEEKKKKGITIAFFRYNESGDFKDADDIEKLDTIAQRLHTEFGIVTFGYTAAAHLFEGTNANDYDFVVKMSGKVVPGFATTTVWGKTTKSEAHSDCMNRYLLGEKHPSLTCHNTTSGYMARRNDTDSLHFRVCPQQLAKSGKERGWAGGTKEFKCMRDCCLCAAPSVNVAFLKH